MKSARLASAALLAALHAGCARAPAPAELEPVLAARAPREPLPDDAERADELECADLAARAALDPRFEAPALECAQALVPRHRESKNHNRHLLALGDLYAALSRGYTVRFPPPSLGFDPATFDEYAHGATRVYEVVAQQDGAVEKLEAAHKLEAFLGFALRVHEERAPR